MQQQTSTLTLKKSRFISSKFGVELTEFPPSFKNAQELAQKLQKPNNAWKTKIYVFRGLMVKARVTNLQKYLKPSFFVITWFKIIFNLKKICIKIVFTSNLALLTLGTRSSVWSLKKNAGNFTVLVCCTAAN